MSQAIIEVENISKRYQIGANKEKYLSIRDEMVKSVRRVVSGVAGMFSQNQQEASDNEQDFWALKDVSFNVQEGEAVGIIGRNGAGKSTLLKILSQITPPTTGKITCRGRIASLLEVGTGFHPELTGRENIYLNGTILGMSRNEVARKFDEIVAFSEVEKFLDTPVKRYSSGMYVRLAFAVAAHLEPEILIVDEVLAVGDAQFQKKCLGKMGEVAKGGRTVLFVSHNMAAVKVLCGKGIVLQEGKMVFSGEIEKCVDKYLGQRLTGGSIKSHITRLHKSIKIDSILVNNSEADVVDLSPGAESLSVEIIGSLLEQMVVELELRIADSQEMPLALFSPGHEVGFTSIKPAGPIRMKYNIKIPRMTQGLYVLNINLTDPGKNGWVDIPNAVVLQSSGVATKSGLVIDYRGGAGFVFLESVNV